MRGKIIILLITFFILFLGLIASIKAIQISTSQLIKEIGPLRMRTGRFEIKGEDIVRINPEISRLRTREGKVVLITNSRFRIFE